MVRPDAPVPDPEVRPRMTRVYRHRLQHLLIAG